jgi:hypothetical protein
MLGAFHEVSVAERAEALHWLGGVADEDAWLAVGVVEEDFAIGAVEERGNKFAGSFWVVGNWDLECFDSPILQRRDLVDEIGTEMWGNVMNLCIVSM